MDELEPHHRGIDKFGRIADRDQVDACRCRRDLPGNLRVVNGLTLNGTIRMIGSASSIAFDGSQTLDGTGAVSFVDNGACCRVLEAVTESTLTIGPGVTIQGGRGVIGGDRNFGQPLSVINQGTILADVAGRTLTIDGRGGAFNNQGLLKATNDGTLDLAAPLTMTQLGTFQSVGGSVNLSATLDNTGATLNIDATTGPLTLGGGAIVGGTVGTSGEVALVATNSGNNLLDGVRLDGDLELPSSSARVRVVNGLTLNGTIHLIGSASS